MSRQVCDSKVLAIGTAKAVQRAKVLIPSMPLGQASPLPLWLRIGGRGSPKLRSHVSLFAGGGCNARGDVDRALLVLRLVVFVRAGVGLERVQDSCTLV